MHSYYTENKEKFKKSLSQFMRLVKPELEKAGGKQIRRAPCGDLGLLRKESSWSASPISAETRSAEPGI